MAFFLYIEDDCDNEVAALCTTLDKYQLPDGSRMYIMEIPAWCFHCDDFTMVEALPAPEVLEASSRRFFEERKVLPVFPADTQENIAQKLLTDGLHHADQWRIALATRLSPARCLRCTMPDHIAIPTDGSWISHPGRRGIKVRVSERFLHASLAESGRLFDVEGFPIEGEFPNLD